MSVAFRTRSGRCSARMIVSGASQAARMIVFRSSRTFPGRVSRQRLHGLGCQLAGLTAGGVGCRVLRKWRARAECRSRAPEAEEVRWSAR
jgi:hypothetical protein